MNNFYTELKPFYNLSKALGVFPKSFDGLPGNGKFKTKWSDIASSFVSLSLALILVLLNIFIDEQEVSSSALLSHLWNLQQLQGIIFIFVASCYQTAKCGSIVKFMSTVSKFDQKVTR